MAIQTQIPEMKAVVSGDIGKGGGSGLLGIESFSISLLGSIMF